MKKLVGGDYLLDLTPIELEESVNVETYTNITNKEIIEQLTNLKKFVPNPSMIKPVWVKLKNGETDEIVVVRGEFKVVDAGEFEIFVTIDGYKLKIHVEFTQALNEDNVPIDDWYIAENDAKYLFLSSGTLNAIDVYYSSRFRGNLQIDGNLKVDGNVAVFENIVDGQGNKRFIEGDIVLSTTTGLTQTYGKWSLSGTHLMFVIAGRFENGTAYAGGDMNEDMNIPEWILDKIIPVFSDRVIQETATFYADDFTNQTTSVSLKKDAVTGKLYIRCGSVTFTAQRNFRFGFDLLIDNETPESQGE